MQRMRELEIKKYILPDNDLLDNIETAIKSAVYMNYRHLYNDASIIKGDKALHCALFFFMRNYAYSGMFRYSNKGEFNVPFGKYKNPKICDSNNFTNLSSLLQKVVFKYGDYKKSSECVDNTTFVYFDPPYRPLTDTASFTAYTKNLFNDEEQIELAEFVESFPEQALASVLTAFTGAEANNVAISALVNKFADIDI